MIVEMGVGVPGNDYSEAYKEYKGEKPPSFEIHENTIKELLKLFAEGNIAAITSLLEPMPHINASSVRIWMNGGYEEMPNSLAALAARDYMGLKPLLGVAIALGSPDEQFDTSEDYENAYIFMSSSVSKAVGFEGQPSSRSEVLSKQTYCENAQPYPENNSLLKECSEIEQYFAKLSFPKLNLLWDVAAKIMAEKQMHYYIAHSEEYMIPNCVGLSNDNGDIFIHTNPYNSLLEGGSLIGQWIAKQIGNLYYQGSSEFNTTLTHETAHTVLREVFANNALPYAKENIKSAQAYQYALDETMVRTLQYHHFIPEESHGNYASFTELFCSHETATIWDYTPYLFSWSAMQDKYIYDKLAYPFCNYQGNTELVEVEAIAVAYEIIAFCELQQIPIPNYIEPLVEYIEEYVSPELLSWKALGLEEVNA